MTTAAPELLELKPTEIHPHPDNPRHDLGDLDDLTASIKAKGIVEPLVVVPADNGKGYRLLMGHRRLAAAKAAKLKTLPCLVRHDLDGDLPAQIELMLVENLQRTELTPLDEAEAYEQLLAFPGYTHAKIASTVGRSKATVTKRVGLTRLGAKTKDAMRRGQLGLDQAEKMVVFAGDKTVSAKLERALAKSPSEFHYALEEARRARERTNAIANASAKLKKARTREVTDLEVAEANGARLDDLDIPFPDHTDCPGHGAVIDTSTWNPGRITYVCLDARQHHPERFAHADGENPERGIVESPEQQAARADEARAAAEEHEQLATAARVRRDHLYRVIMGDPDVAQVSALQLMRDAVFELGNGGRDLAVDILGIKVDTDTATKAEVDTELQAALSRLTLEQLVLLYDVATEGAVAEVSLATGRAAFGYGYVYGISGAPGYKAHDGTAQWRGRLTNLYGYEWTDVEQAFIDRRAAELAEEVKRYRPVIDAHLPEPEDSDDDQGDES